MSDNKVVDKTYLQRQFKNFKDSLVETDPTVPAWAKAETKPSYTAEEIEAVAESNYISIVDIDRMLNI